MIQELLIDLEDNVTSNIVDQLSEINLEMDAVIVYKFSRLSQSALKEVDFNVDGFDIKTIEKLHPKQLQNRSVYYEYPRIKMLLPHGIFPMFECKLPGLKIHTENIEKMQGVQVSQELNYKDKIINIRGEQGYYSIYKSFQFTLEQYDYQSFKNNEFMGNIIPTDIPILTFRLIPHFTGQFPELNKLFLICSSYLHDRFPDF